MISNNIDRTFEQLKEQERLVFNHALIISYQTAKAIAALEQSAYSDARVLLMETSITAYEAEYNLPCRKKVPRFVYASPMEIKVWPAGGNPLPVDAIHVRGNYLKNLSGKSLFVRGLPGGGDLELSVFAASQQEVTLKITSEFIQRAQQIATETTLAIAGNYEYCRTTGEQAVSASLKLVPPDVYEIYAKVTPSGVVPTFATLMRSYSNGTYGKCDREFDDSETYPIVAPLMVAGQPTYRTTLDRCGSRIVDVNATSPNAVVLRAHIKGCGYNWLINCKGNGVIAATVSIPVRENVRTPFAVVESTREIVENTAVIIPYENVYPTNMVGDPECKFYARVKSKATGEVTELNESNSTINGISVTWNKNCDLSVTVAS
jgi:hypothetical protein